MRIGQSSAINFASEVAASFLGFVATVYLARTLGPGPLGVYFVVLAVLIWLKVIGGFGVQTAVRKRMSEAGEDGPYLTAGMVLQLAIYLLIVLVLYVTAPYVTAYVRGVSVFVLAAILLVVLLLSFVTNTLDGAHLVHVSSLLKPLERLLRSGLQVGLVVLGFELGGLLFGYAVGALVAAAVGAFLAPVRPALPERRHFEELVSYARYSWLGTLSARAFASMDTLVLGLFVSSGLIGIYEISWSLASILAVFGTSIGRAMFPEISRLSSESDLSSVSGLVTDSIRYAGLLLIPGLVGVALLGNGILAVYGQEFSRGYLVLVVLVLARLIHIYAVPFTNTLNAIDRPDLAFRIDVSFIVTNVGLNLVLVYLYGWIGAAVATAVSATVAVMLGYSAVDRLTGVTLPLGDLGRQWMAAIAMGIVIYVGEFFLPTTVPVTVALVGIGAGTYFMALYAISIDFRTTIRNNLPL